MQTPCLFLQGVVLYQPRALYQEGHDVDEIFLTGELFLFENHLGAVDGFLQSALGNLGGYLAGKEQNEQNGSDPHGGMLLIKGFRRLQ